MQCPNPSSAGTDAPAQSRSSPCNCSSVWAAKIQACPAPAAVLADNKGVGFDRTPTTYAGAKGDPVDVSPLAVPPRLPHYCVMHCSACMVQQP